MSAIGSAGTASFGIKVEGATQVVQEFAKVQQGMTALEGSVNKLRTVIGQGFSSGLPAGFEQISTGAETATVKTQTFTERMTGFQGNLLNAATSVGTFTASIFGIDAAMDNLTRTELALEQARVRQSNMQTTLQAQELRLNELRTSGTATAEEIAVAEERVNTTRQQLEVQTEKVSFMQQNLNEDYDQFGAQILPQVITATLSGVTAFQSIFQLIGKNEKAVAILNKGWTALSSAFSSVPIAPLTGALSGATAATTGWHAVLATVPLALTAIGAAVAIAGGAIALYTTNAFGARDAMHATGEAIGTAIPPLQGFLNLLEDSGRLWGNILKGEPDFNKSMGEITNTVMNAEKDIGSSVQTIQEHFDVFTTNFAKNFPAAAQKAETALGSFQEVFGNQEPYIKASAGADLLMQTIEQLGKEFFDGKKITQANLNAWSADVEAWSKNTQQGFKEAGLEIPVFLTEIERLSKELGEQLFNEKNLSPEQLKEKINAILANINSTILKWGPEFQASLTDVIQKAVDPVGFHLEEIQKKLTALKLPPELALETTRFTENIQGMVDATLEQIDTLALSDEQMQKIAYSSLPALTKGLQATHPEIQTNADTLQWFVDNIDETTAKANPLIKAILDMANAAGIQKTKTGEVTEKLTEEQQKIKELAKDYFDLNLTTEDEIRANEQRVNTVTDVIESYTDEIASLKELRAQYGENEMAVYGINQATQDRIDALQEEILAEQDLTLAAIDVTAALEDTTETQILLNDAMIEGTTAAADFVTELVTAEKQTEAYGQALAENVMAVLEEMPQAIGDFADAFKEALPNLFASLEEFQGKITPFDKQSIKDYKAELKDLDVPKSLRDLYIDSAKVWQDKDEIIAEGEALFAGMAGSLVHNFEDIEPEDVYTFLDELTARLDDLEAEGMAPQFTQGVRDLIDEIMNADDPVMALMQNFDKLKGAMDPEAFAVVEAAIKVFGSSVGTVVQNAIMPAITGTDQWTASLQALSEVDLSNIINQLGQARQGLTERLQGGEKGVLGELIDVTAAEGAAKGVQKQKQGVGAGGGAVGAEESALAWENAQLRIQTATTGITTAITTMSTTIQTTFAAAQTAINTSLLLMIQGVLNTQTSWSTFSTSLATYGTSMSTNFAAAQTLINGSLLLMIEGVINTNTQWSTFSTSLATYSTSMSTNFGTAQQAINESLLLMIEGVENTNNTWSIFSNSVATYSKSMATNFDEAQKAINQSLLLQIEGVENTNDAWSVFSTSVATYCESMTANIEEWTEAVQANMDDAAEAFGKAEDAVNSLQDAIAALKSKTVTIKVNIEKTGGGSSGGQYGGVEILDKSKIFMGGEGSKPEIHFFYPLDQMSQSHAKSEFTLPFNIGDLTGPKLNAASIAGAGGGAAGTPQMVLPSNLVSNINMRANLNIDLGNEIKKVVRQEIKAISEARLDRMPMR